MNLDGQARRTFGAGFGGVCLSLLLALLPGATSAAQPLRLATTTSIENSGLLNILHPLFEEVYKVKVQVIASGTGKALRLGRQGDVDLIMAHAPEAEQAFVDAGHGLARLPIMHNDFILVGPAADPAAVGATNSLREALHRIASSASDFISRGDNSGTHTKERLLWRLAGLQPQGRWYLSVGQGMGATLRIADDKQCYTLTDRGTYLAFRDKIDLSVVYEGAPELKNPYHLILINPARHPHIKAELAQRYAAFVRSEQGQRIIRDFRIAGEPLFRPALAFPP